MSRSAKSLARHPNEKSAVTAATVSPLDLLLPYQARWINDQSRFKIGVQARQTGKSFQTACEAAKDAFIDAGTTWVCLSSGERQSLEWMQKCKEWAEEFRFSIENYADDPDNGEIPLQVVHTQFI